MWFFSYQTGVIKASIAFVIIFEFDTTVLALKSDQTRLITDTNCILNYLEIYTIVLALKKVDNLQST